MSKTAEKFINGLSKLLINPEKDKADIAQFIVDEISSNDELTSIFGEIDETLVENVAMSNNKLSDNELEVIYKAQRKADGMIEFYDVQRQTRELKKSVAALPGKEEARFFVDCYYQVQGMRLRLENQIRAVIQQRDNNQPIEDEDNEPGKKKTKILSQNTTFMGYILRSIRTIEDSIKCGLEEFTNGSYIGKWCREVVGIGPVFATCLMAGIDLKDTPEGNDTMYHAANIWSYCGLNNNRRPWLGKEKSAALVKKCIEEAGGKLNDETVMRISALSQWKFSVIKENAYNEETGKWDKEKVVKTISKIPYNKDLKVLMYKIGESFLKQINKEQSLYGHLLTTRKDYEIMKNERGDYAEQAAKELESKNITKPNARKAYTSGKLPAGHILSRSRRYAVKLFMSHFYEAMYFNKYGKLPAEPYVLVFNEGHTDYIGPEVDYFWFDRDPEYVKKNPTDPELLPKIKLAKEEYAEILREREEEKKAKKAEKKNKA